MLPNFLINLINRISYHPSPEDVELIKNTHLFDQASEAQLATILSSIRLIKYGKDELVFQEGDLPDALYIIVSGSVRVFTYHARGEKIPLARLNKGDFFGEQAIIGEVNRTRNASIETIDPTTLIYIDNKVIYPLWKKDAKLKQELKKIGRKQAIHGLASSVQMYDEIKPILEEIDKNIVVDYKKNAVIFNAGDKAKKVYLILKGQVELIFPTTGEHKKKHIILHKGHFFGELGVLENKPRQATAIANNHLQLLEIDGEHLKAAYDQNKTLKKLFSSLKQIYQLPLHGSVQQFMGNQKDLGPTITNIYKMDDGRTIMAVHALDRNVFTMAVSYSSQGKIYKFLSGPEHFVQLAIVDNLLVSVESFDGWSDLPTACYLILNGEKIEKKLLEHFVKTGELFTQKTAEQEDVICTCMGIKRQQLQQLIHQGISDFTTLAKETGVATVCGSCKFRVLEMLGQNSLMEAEMQLHARHNRFITSYLIKLKNSKFNPIVAGQHVVVQAQVNGDWVERPYTISAEQNEHLRITIKKEPQGFFTRWLFDQAPESFAIKVTQPQGHFTLNKETNQEALCFAGGIGITPFIMYAAQLAKENNPKKIHILYCALTKNDFVLINEFKMIIDKNPSITIMFRDNEAAGILTKEEVMNIVKSFREPDIYICGPEGFERVVADTLNSINYDKSKIHIEQFVHAGSPRRKLT